MNYTVIYLPDAEQELAALWLDPVTRAVVSASANEIDDRLKRNPLNEGESRSAGRRILFVLPLGCIFRVNEQAKIVFVSHIWMVAPGGPQVDPSAN